MIPSSGVQQATHGAQDGADVSVCTATDEQAIGKRSRTYRIEGINYVHYQDSQRTPPFSLAGPFCKNISKLYERISCVDYGSSSIRSTTSRPEDPS